ncbi:uncharacterized protein LOC143196734 [Rhynchophorus ferrugineus]|uniref:uncharacterized protein LOC143196734 n=1 Tax=Rhynchophorus ferrugineus TaxID=354439 RepID=UPI003FCDE73B
MAEGGFNIIGLPDILSKSYHNKVAVIKESIKQLNKPSNLELTTIIKRRYSLKTVKVIYFVKVCERDLKVGLRVDLMARFKVEVGFYNSIIPSISEFQRSKGVYFDRLYYHLFPLCIGARISTDVDRKVPDESGVLLLENLKEKGYSTPEAKEGLDLAGCKLVLARMAQMHAVPLAMRLIKRDMFEERIVPTLMAVQQEKNIYCRQYINELIDLGLKSKTITAFIESIRMNVDISLCNYCISNPPENSGWKTLCHSNLSNSNIMIYNKNRRPRECKILGFKDIQYSHCCNDLLFFLFTSVNYDVLEDDFNLLINYYFFALQNVIEEYEVASWNYSINDFHKEVDREGPLMLVKILEAVANITCDKYDRNGHPVVGRKFEKKLIFILKFMISRKWFRPSIKTSS